MTQGDIKIKLSQLLVELRLLWKYHKGSSVLLIVSLIKFYIIFQVALTIYVYKIDLPVYFLSFMVILLFGIMLIGCWFFIICYIIVPEENKKKMGDSR